MASPNHISGLAYVWSLGHLQSEPDVDSGRIWNLSFRTTYSDAFDSSDDDDAPERQVAGLLSLTPPPGSTEHRRMRNRFDIKWERHGCTFNDDASTSIFRLMALLRTRPNPDRRVFSGCRSSSSTNYGTAYSRVVSREESTGLETVRIVATALDTLIQIFELIQTPPALNGSDFGLVLNPQVTARRAIPSSITIGFHLRICYSDLMNSFKIAYTNVAHRRSLR
ncbi:hypothetical protein ARMGADRAFT_1070553 [Armillaria gallica]|uniref:Uncharacterized protein n=1 Tax=Armillaria gallica TaxID=47427 RepID=A0A2H3ECS5_ARMGA|nr:hypothetical protein ARMGADRAFT_1070553 [Armillaria gallica]